MKQHLKIILLFILGSIFQASNTSWESTNGFKTDVQLYLYTLREIRDDVGNASVSELVKVAAFKAAIAALSCEMATGTHGREACVIKGSESFPRTLIVGKEVPKPDCPTADNILKKYFMPFLLPTFVCRFMNQV